MKTLCATIRLVLSIGTLWQCRVDGCGHTLGAPLKNIGGCHYKTISSHYVKLRFTSDWKECVLMSDILSLAPVLNPHVFARSDNNLSVLPWSVRRVCVTGACADTEASITIYPSFYGTLKSPCLGLQHLLLPKFPPRFAAAS